MCVCGAGRGGGGVGFNVLCMMKSMVGLYVGILHYFTVSLVTLGFQCSLLVILPSSNVED